MASQDRARSTAGRKPIKKRTDPQGTTRGRSLDIPERFKDGDDAHEDVTAPKKDNTMSMNQSIFSMIARAGQQSQTDLGIMQEVDSGDSEAEEGQRAPGHNLDGAARLSRLRSTNDFQNPPEDLRNAKVEKNKHRWTLSENKLLRSSPKSNLLDRKATQSEDPPTDPMSSSQFLQPKQAPNDRTILPSQQPPRSEARAEVTSDDEVDTKKGGNTRQGGRHRSSAGLDQSKVHVTLAQRIQQIFGFNEAEEIISEYPCWLLQSILLQGYMYITQRHICFYAYIPKKHVSFSRMCSRVIC